MDHYAHSALPLLLPAVEEGIFAENWRIRQSSVKLLGKLLFKVGCAQWVDTQPVLVHSALS